MSSVDCKNCVNFLEMGEETKRGNEALYCYCKLFNKQLTKKVTSCNAFQAKKPRFLTEGM